MSKNESENASWLRPLPEGYTKGNGMPRRRIIFISATLLILILFGSFIWYSYTQSVDTGIIPVIKADNSVIKEKPDKPGGKEILYQDREVFARVDSVEKQDEDTIASSSEIPLKRPTSDLGGEVEIEDGVSVAMPTVDVSLETNKTVLLTEEKTEIKPAEKPAEIVVTEGLFLVQLGAFSKQQNAENAWASFQEKNKEVLGNLTPIYAQVVALYSVRAGMIKTRAEADKICAELKSKNQGCMVVTN
jgi:cell division septation protein DedD